MSSVSHAKRKSKILHQKNSNSQKKRRLNIEVRRRNQSRKNVNHSKLGQTYPADIKILTVAEDNYISNRITAYMESHETGNAVKFSISDECMITMESFYNGRPTGMTGNIKVDISQMRSFLLEAEQYIAEAQIVKKLIGK